MTGCAVDTNLIHNGSHSKAGTTANNQNTYSQLRSLIIIGHARFEITDPK